MWTGLGWRAIELAPLLLVGWLACRRGLEPRSEPQLVCASPARPAARPAKCRIVKKLLDPLSAVGHASFTAGGGELPYGPAGELDGDEALNDFATRRFDPHRAVAAAARGGRDLMELHVREALDEEEQRIWWGQNEE